MAEITFKCAATKKDCKAESREAAAKHFLCDKCLSLKNNECAGPIIKNQNESNAREALKKLALRPRPKRGEIKTLALLFIQEIKAARKAGYGYKAIAKILRDNGYAMGVYGAGLELAFKRLCDERA